MAMISNKSFRATDRGRFVRSNSSGFKLYQSLIPQFFQAGSSTDRVISPAGSSTHRVMSFKDKGTKRGAENIGRAPTRRRYDEETMKAFSDQTEMDPKLWNKLEDDFSEKIGEDLLLKIVTRLPLKDLVRSQALSKTWRSRFLSPSFQKEVSKHSSEWEPCNFYHPLCVTEKGLCGYDRSTQKWKNLCTLPEFPPDFFSESYKYEDLDESDSNVEDLDESDSNVEDLDESDNNVEDLNESDSNVEDFDESDSNVGGSRWRLWGSNCFVVGPLVFSGHLSCDGLDIFVTNVINKTTRRLPPLWLSAEDASLENILEFSSITLHPVGHNHYKMVMFSSGSVGHPDTIFAAVYDSKSNSWTDFHSVLPRNWTRCGNPVYVKGVVYFPYSPHDVDGYSSVGAFWTFDVEKGEFANITPPQRVSFDSWNFVAWQSDLLLVSDLHYRQINRDLAFHGVNLETLELVETFRGPSKALDGWDSLDFVISDSDCIHLILQPYVDPYADEEEDSDLDVQGLRADKSVLDGKICLATYNVNKELWSYSYVNSCDAGDARIELCNDSAFQPNLCPFLIA